MKKIMFNDSFGLTKAVKTGDKTMTRRIAYDFRKHTSHMVFRSVLLPSGSITYMDGKVQVLDELPKPRYKVGEVVAVAQSYKDLLGKEYLPPKMEDEIGVLIAKNHPGITNKLFVRADLMPLRIKMVNYRVERLQDISDEDCMKEGITSFKNKYGVDVYSIRTGSCFSTAKIAFAALIDKTCGKGTWESNPYVHVYEFEKDK